MENLKPVSLKPKMTDDEIAEAVIGFISNARITYKKHPDSKLTASYKILDRLYFTIVLGKAKLEYRKAVGGEDIDHIIQGLLTDDIYHMHMSMDKIRDKVISFLAQYNVIGVFKP